MTRTTVIDAIIDILMPKFDRMENNEVRSFLDNLESKTYMTCIPLCFGVWCFMGFLGSSSACGCLCAYQLICLWNNNNYWKPHPGDNWQLHDGCKGVVLRKAAFKVTGHFCPCTQCESVNCHPGEVSSFKCKLVGMLDLSFF